MGSHSFDVIRIHAEKKDYKIGMDLKFQSITLKTRYNLGTDMSPNDMLLIYRR